MVRAVVVATLRRALHGPSPGTAGRRLSTEPQWAETLQLAQVKPPEFYEAEAEHRRYFFHVDSTGRLFVEDVKPKNLTTCQKSAKFLDFFFRQLRPNDTGLAHLADYPLISPCGKEMNFIKPALTGIVFHELRPVEPGEDRPQLVFGGTMTQPLDPAGLRMSTDGHLYHTLTAHPHAASLGQLALVRSQVALELCERHVEFDERVDVAVEDSEHVFHWEGRRHRITMIPGLGDAPPAATQTERAR